MNYSDYLFSARHEWLDNLALIDANNDERFTYRELQQAVLWTAHRLKRLGFQPGEVVVIHLYNSAQVVIVHLAVQYIGGVSCLLDPLIPVQGLAYYLEDAGAHSLFTHVSKAQTEGLFSPPLIVIEAGEIEAFYREQGEAEPFEPFCFADDQLAAVFYTSGTTGFPKGVMLSPKNFRSHLNIFKRCCYRYQPGDRLLCFVPFSHGYGSKSLFLPCMDAGATFIILKSFHPLKVVELVEQEGITHLFGVPAHYQQLLRRDEFIEPLNKLKAAFSAAALLPLETARLWKEKVGIFLDEGYGLIETCTGVVFRIGRLPERLGHIGGYPADLVDVEIMDEQNNVLPPTERGEIVVRGGSVMSGYLNKPLETTRSLSNGWFRTGDMGYQTTDGQVFLTGRLKDVINIAGIKVAPFEVESAINENSAVVESAVVGVDDEMYGEVVKAFVKLVPGAVLDQRDLQVFLQKRLMNFQVPKEIVFVDAFPRNNMGKIDKKALRG